MREAKRGRGRPPKGEVPMDRRLELRLSDESAVAWETAARAKGLDLSEWVRSVCDRAAKRPR